MNTNLVLIAALVSIAIGLLALGWMSHAWLRRRRHLHSPISVDGLAERADINGSELVKIARFMRAAAVDEQRESRRAQLQDWARRLEQVAVEHLECINAISLDALQTVSERQPIHLGDFRAALRADRRRQPGQGPFATVLLRGGPFHG